MAITRVTAQSAKAQVHMYGLAADLAGIDTNGVSIGFKFRETDSLRRVFIWTGTAWVVLEI